MSYDVAKATSYAEWAEAAQRSDLLTGKKRWRERENTVLYDHSSIRRRLDSLNQLRDEGKDDELLFMLNEGIHGNMDGIANDELWREAQFGTKILIHQYVEAVSNALEYLADESLVSISIDEKLDFFHRASHSYGESSLLLSGAGAYLYFHVGVARTLLAEGILPRIVSGSSGGAAIGAMLCTHPDDELEELLTPENQIAYAHAELNASSAASVKDANVVQDKLSELIARTIPDLTFQQAYERTGRHLNISVAPAEKHQNGRLLNAMTCPNVCIREAVLASCAVPGIFEPVMLMARNHKGKRVSYLPDRQWVDGSVTDDLPFKRLSRLYGVNHHIVSQANPLVTPFALGSKQPRSNLESVKRAMGSTARTWFSLNLQLIEKPLTMFAPKLQELSSLSQAVFNQDYLGDINIVRPTLYWGPKKILSAPLPEDIEMLIEMGEKATWPKVEMIRVQTLISRKLEEILENYDAFPHDSSLYTKSAVAARKKRNR